MALVERLMQLETPKIFHHIFIAANRELLEGAVTVAQIKNFFQMDSAAGTEYDNLIALAPPPAQTAARAMYLLRVDAVFTLAGIRAPNYDTPAAVRTKLGLP